MVRFRHQIVTLMPNIRSRFMDTAAIGTNFVLILFVATGATGGATVYAAGAVVTDAKIDRSATP